MSSIAGKSILMTKRYESPYHTAELVSTNMRYSEIVVETLDFFIPRAFNASVRAVPVGILP